MSIGKNIAIITARGGSKRIPHKNIKDFCGKPIIAYSIEAALQSGCFDEVMVSTDDEKIAEIAKKYGAKVPFMRSEQTSNDFATTADVLVEVLNCYIKCDMHFDNMCCIYPTAPFVTSEKLHYAMNKLNEENVFGVVPVVPFSFPIQRSFRLDVNNKIEIAYPEYFLCRSQDLEKYYHDCGQYYCFRVNEFLKSKSLVSDNTFAVITSELEVQDIDNDEDWKLAEIKYRYLREI